MHSPCSPIRHWQSSRFVQTTFLQAGDQSLPSYLRGSFDASLNPSPTQKDDVRRRYARRASVRRAKSSNRFFMGQSALAVLRMRRAPPAPHFRECLRPHTPVAKEKEPVVAPLSYCSENPVRNQELLPKQPLRPTLRSRNLTEQVFDMEIAYTSRRLRTFLRS